MEDFLGRHWTTSPQTWTIGIFYWPQMNWLVGTLEVLCGGYLKRWWQDTLTSTTCWWEPTGSNIILHWNTFHIGMIFLSVETGTTPCKSLPRESYGQIAIHHQRINWKWSQENCFSNKQALSGEFWAITEIKTFKTMFIGIGLKCLGSHQKITSIIKDMNSVAGKVAGMYHECVGDWKNKKSGNYSHLKEFNSGWRGAFAKKNLLLEISHN